MSRMEDQSEKIAVGAIPEEDAVQYPPSIS